MVLTAERLVKLAYKYPSLYNNWYVLASSALAVVNQPQEIGKVFHFALRQQLLESSVSDKPLLTDPFMLKLAEDSIASAVKYDEFTAIGVNLPDILIPYTYHDKLPLTYKYNRSEDIYAAQSAVANRIREALLKVAPIAGLPRSINALTALKKVTPNSIRPEQKPKRPCVLTPGHVRSSDLVQEDFAGTRFESDEIPTCDTLEGPVSLLSVNSETVLNNTVRGLDLWQAIYGKIGNRVKNQMFNAYPDLWQYAYNNVYGPILSFTDIVSAKETSFVVISALIPQDVNPTLKGHLKGALNQGASKEEIESVRCLTFDICDWSGNVSWKNGKESVAKL
ncbi:hypothetical protein PUMCH_002266 [Australozyma saopauloensis]|uniref:Carboxymuconolactone decarboxylase-like domain-containing protein n=1 Tax=Australozyma saopauloensis TaxID=291208 RepID=A0AAX4H900_9ASCO|nr:hypothetical protein PUMCH_002266 [[Candida] saopauloensis]